MNILKKKKKKKTAYWDCSLIQQTHWHPTIISSKQHPHKLQKPFPILRLMIVKSPFRGAWKHTSWAIEINSQKHLNIISSNEEWVTKTRTNCYNCLWNKNQGPICMSSLTACPAVCWHLFSCHVKNRSSALTRDKILFIIISTLV